MAEPSTDPQNGVPADHGLSSLGLLMQLAGSVFAAAAGLLVLQTMLDEGHALHEVAWKIALLLVSLGRALLHRQAGTTLLYGVAGAPEGQKHRMRGVRHYIAAGLAHSLIVAVTIALPLHAPMKAAVAAGLGLAVWPAFLAVLLALPRFRPFHDDLPVTEDKGFEGAAILMTVLGLCGAIGAATLLVTVIGQDEMMSHGPGVLIAGALVMLVVRSVLHVQAGVTGLRETSMDRAIELVNRYASFGIISSFCGAGALLLFFVTQHANVLGLAMITALCWMLMAWPLTIRQFVSDRQFADLMAGDNAPVHRRAPDAGLTSLGWLLIGHAMLSATIVVPQLVGGSLTTASVLAGMGLRSIWFSVGVVVLQTWAGYELVRMSRQSRAIASVYGVVAAATAIYVNYPTLRALQHGRGITSNLEAAAVGPLVLALVLPVAALVLVNRTIAPTARARFRPKVQSTP